MHRQDEGGQNVILETFLSHHDSQIMINTYARNYLQKILFKRLTGSGSKLSPLQWSLAADVFAGKAIIKFWTGLSEIQYNAVQPD